MAGLVAMAIAPRAVADMNADNPFLIDFGIFSMNPCKIQLRPHHDPVHDSHSLSHRSRRLAMAGWRQVCFL
jgi:hypothetical protein